MPDNTTLNAGSGGDTISTDDLGAGVKVQRVKVQFGADGSATDASPANPLPVGAALARSAVMDGAVALTPKFARIGASAAGVTTLLPAVAGRKLSVLSMLVVAAGDVSLYLRDDTPTALSGDATNPIALSGGPRGFALAFSPVGHFETGVGKALQVSLSAAVAIAGHIVYLEV